MSKSDEDERSRIELTDTTDEIHLKIKKAVTDAIPHITYDPEGRPGISNLVDIHAAVTGKTKETICSESVGLDTVEYKIKLAEDIDSKINPIRQKISHLQNDKGYVHKVLDNGALKASSIAEHTFKEIQRRVGII